MWQNYLLWAKGLFSVGRYFFEYKEKSLAILYTIFFKSKGGFASYNPTTCPLQSLTKEKEKERWWRGNTQQDTTIRVFFPWQTLLYFLPKSLEFFHFSSVNMTNFFEKIRLKFQCHKIEKRKKKTLATMEWNESKLRPCNHNKWKMKNWNPIKYPLAYLLTKLS